VGWGFGVASNYAYNINLGYKQNADMSVPLSLQYEQWPIRTTRVPHPAQVYRMMDGKGPNELAPIPSFNVRDTYIQWRHGRGHRANVLFADGHVQSLAYGDVAAGEITPSAARPRSLNDPWMGRYQTDR
jgi:prepilin-type processing-associated H-X9-DG protein